MSNVRTSQLDTTPNRRDHCLWYSSVTVRHGRQMDSPALVKKFPTFYGTRRFNAAFTTACPYLNHSNQGHGSPSNFLKIQFNISLPSKPGSSKWPLSLRFTHQSHVCTALLSIRATCPAHLILLDFVTRTLFVEQYRS